MGVRKLGIDVFTAALDRITGLYREGHEVVVSFSGGKDSGVLVELSIIAARATNRLPVKVVTRDEEIMFPGTFEYSARTAARPEVEFHWMVARQPIVNIFNRKAPYFWAFDPLLNPDDWVRRPPNIAYDIPEKHIQGMVTPERFPPAPGKELITLIGLRTSESVNRKMGMHSSGSFLTKPTPFGSRLGRPIYDWRDGDVWRAVREGGWDYNEAYNVYVRFGVPIREQRIAPPTLSAAGVNQLGVAAKAWPTWFNKVCTRLEGVRSAAQFGRRAVEPIRRQGESWIDVHRRECVERAPKWIAERAVRFRDEQIASHSKHSALPFPEVKNCPRCGMLGSWRSMSRTIYMGDPFGLKTGLRAGILSRGRRRLGRAANVVKASKVISLVPPIELRGWRWITAGMEWGHGLLVGDKPLPKEFIEEIGSVVQARGHSVRASSGGPGSLGDHGGLDYEVVTGDVIKADVPRLWGFGTVPGFARTISNIVGEPMRLSEDACSSVTINRLQTIGARYELHTDLAGWSAVLFLTTIPRGDGGELVLHYAPNTFAKVFPVAGLMVVFNAQEIPHEVAALRTEVTRLTAIFSFLPVGSMADRGTEREEANKYLFTASESSTALAG